MPVKVSEAVASIEKCLQEANIYYSKGDNYDPRDRNEEHEIAEYYVERAFIGLLVLVEHLGLVVTHQQITTLFEKAKKEGFLQSNMGSEEPYLVWCEKIRMFVDAISGAHGLGETGASEIRDLKAIMKRAVYVICDTSIFPHVPKNESDVHNRLEAILKCHFQDLKRKPALTKPIKNFEPDTGIPSTKTLIEYKFVNTKAEAKRVVDEILTDTSGYRSPQWRSLLFVIYETHRVLPEEEWLQLLKECDLEENYDVIVLSGDAK